MNELKPERKRELQEAQRLWIKYTEVNCNFYLDPDGGTSQARRKRVSGASQSIRDAISILGASASSFMIGR